MCASSAHFGEVTLSGLATVSLTGCLTFKAREDLRKLTGSGDSPTELLKGDFGVVPPIAADFAGLLLITG